LYLDPNCAFEIDGPKKASIQNGVTGKGLRAIGNQAWKTERLERQVPTIEVLVEKEDKTFYSMEKEDWTTLVSVTHDDSDLIEGLFWSMRNVNFNQKGDEGRTPCLDFTAPYKLLEMVDVDIHLKDNDS
jgi:hypothetical protein